MPSNLLLIGAGPGIGLAVARRFGREGFRVGLVARRTERLQALAEDLRRADIQTEIFQADAAHFTAIRGAVADATAQMGNIDVLVYNASILRQQTPLELEAEQLVQDFRANAAGALAAVQAVAPSMLAAGRGTVLITGGGLALAPAAPLAALAVGKVAVRHLALMLAEELQPKGIHVATVTVNGFVRKDTPFDPDRIADVYWQLHAEAPGAWRAEVVFNG